jgi:hypothetical protein
MGAYACKKDEKKKGCMDTSSVNYDETAEEDDGSCQSVGASFAGSWNVKQTLPATTDSMYKATITTRNDTAITITYHPNVATNKIPNPCLLNVNWTTKKILYKSQVAGTITDKNHFKLNFYYIISANQGSQVVQTLSR